MDFVDWRTAQRIGDAIAGSPPYGGISAATIEPRAHDFAERVATYSGLKPTRELPPLEVVDRSAWIAANLKTMRPLLSPLTAKMGADKGLLAAPVKAVSGLALGAQVGALTGLLSQRVLGQYDLALLDASVTPRLLLLGPNLAQAARVSGLDRDELVLWVTIHEITHAVQFSGAPWLREYLGGILMELIEGLQLSGVDDEEKPSLSARLNGWAKMGGGLLPGQADLREMVEKARRGELLRLTLGEDRWQLVEKMQAAMSLIEGHAEHTMDVIGVEVLPSLPRLRKAMDRRRSERGLPWRVLERLMGLELKMKQYEQGRSFCDAVVREGGPEALARAWRGAEHLPSATELEQPSLWLARTRPGELPSPAAA